MQANISHSRKIYERLVEAAESRGESLASLSKDLGLHVSSFYRWKSGSVPHDRTVRLVADKLRVREAWLRDGDEPRDLEDVTRIVSSALPKDAKDEVGSERVEGSSSVIRIRPSPIPAASAISAAASRLTEEQLEDVLSTSVQRLREETEPLLKLGYLATMRACAADLERRLVDGPAD